MLTSDGWGKSRFLICSGGRWSVKRDLPEVSGQFILQQINSQKLQNFEEREKELKNQIHYVKYNIMRKYQNISAATKTGGWRRGWGISWWYLSATKPGMEAEALGSAALGTNNFPTKFCRRPGRAEGISWMKSGDSLGTQETSLKALLPPSKIHLRHPYLLCFSLLRCT